MKARPVQCEACMEQPADIYAEGYWLCTDCEDEFAEDKLISGLELASIFWKCKAKLIRGGKLL